MTTSTYFSKFDHFNEQNLYEDLIIESIKVYGIDCYYVPRTLNKLDNLYGEDILSSFDKAYPIEMYIKSVNGFEGEGDLVSKFGLEIRDQITFSVSRRRFKSLQYETRPKEGDLIFFPLNNKLFEIQFVEHEAFFYQTGRLQTFDITCQLFEYSDETISTGIEDIDKIEDNYSYTILYKLLNVSGTFTINEQVIGSTSNTTATILKSNVLTNELTLANFTGNFSNNEIITGQTSNATANITTSHVEQTTFANDPLASNQSIQTYANTIIDFSEQNPFSEGSF